MLHKRRAGPARPSEWRSSLTSCRLLAKNAAPRWKDPRESDGESAADAKNFRSAVREMAPDSGVVANSREMMRTHEPMGSDVPRAERSRQSWPRLRCTVVLEQQLEAVARQVFADTASVADRWTMLSVELRCDGRLSSAGLLSTATAPTSATSRRAAALIFHRAQVTKRACTGRRRSGTGRETGGAAAGRRRRVPRRRRAFGVDVSSDRRADQRFTMRKLLDSSDVATDMQAGDYGHAQK